MMANYNVQYVHFLRPIVGSIWYSLSEAYQQPVCLRVVLQTADTVVYSTTKAPSQYNYTLFYVMVILGEC